MNPAAMETENQQIPDTTELLTKIWTNELIWKEITDYLTISDLKNLSQVNSYFLERVRSLTRFTSLAGQVVTGQMEIHTFKLCKAIVEVNKLGRIALEEKAATVFKDTEYLELQHLENLPEEDRNSRLIHIVSNCNNLKSLVIGGRNWLKYNFKTFFEDPNVKSIFCHIKELGVGYPHKEYNPNLPLNVELEVKELLIHLQLTLEKLSYLDPKECSASCFYPELILRTSLNTLTDLTLNICADGLEPLRPMKFHILRKFKLAVFGSDMSHRRRNAAAPPMPHLEENYTHIFAENLLPFLRAHLSTLSEFVLHSFEQFSLEDVCQVLKSSRKMKVFQVGLHMYKNLERLLSSVNWDFLQNMSSLESIKIIRYGSNGMGRYSKQDDGIGQYNLGNTTSAPILQMSGTKTWDRYFSSLPANIKSICFRGFHIFGRQKDFTSAAISQLMRFENLSVLTMSVAPLFFNDEILQCICKHLTKLRVLKGNFSLVTDFGISGCHEDGSHSGVSLKNLKGLKKLEMNSYRNGECLLITWDGLLRSIQFLELITLSITAGVTTTGPDFQRDEQYLKLVRQNPSLERVSLAFYSPRSVYRDVICRRLNFKPVIKRNAFGQLSLSRIDGTREIINDATMTDFDRTPNCRQLSN